jgi:hypothetical protein
MLPAHELHSTIFYEHVRMNKQVVTRRRLFALGLMMLAGQAVAEDKEHGQPRSRHRGYKTGGGMVIMIMVAVFGGMALFGEFRRRRLPSSASPSPGPLPEGTDWEADMPASEQTEVPAPASFRQRRNRRTVAGADSAPEN